MNPLPDQLTINISPEVPLEMILVRPGPPQVARLSFRTFSCLVVNNAALNQINDLELLY